MKSEDGAAPFAVEGAYAVAENYEEYLTNLLALKEGQGAALTHLQRFVILKGDAADKLEEYLHHHPETLIAFAYFDMDIYAPTEKCLRLIQKHLTKGSVVGFDELNFADFPGETCAFQEVVGSVTVKLRRTRTAAPRCSMWWNRIREGSQDRTRSSVSQSSSNRTPAKGPKTPSSHRRVRN